MDVDRGRAGEFVTVGIGPLFGPVMVQAALLVNENVVGRLAIGPLQSAAVAVTATTWHSVMVIAAVSTDRVGV